MAYSTSNRFLYLGTPLPDGTLLLNGFHGQEGISNLFRFELDLIAPKAFPAEFDKLIGEKVKFGIRGTDSTGAPRHFSGVVIELTQGARDTTFISYRMTVAPEVWKLTRKFRSRIFQQQTVPEILETVFETFDFKNEIQGDFEPREYCTQFQESDFSFASRLMEEEGIYFYFRFTEGVHKLVLANTPGSHDDIPEDSEVLFDSVDGGTQDEKRIDHWDKVQAWGSGKYTLWDHHFELPHKHLEAEQIVKDSVKVGTVQHKLKLAGNDTLDVLEYPGRYALRFDGIDKAGGEQPEDLEEIFRDNKRTAGIRMERTESPMIRLHASGDYRQITSGHKFTLQGHFNGDGAYVVEEVTHQANEGSFRSDSQNEVENHYSNAFTCFPYALPYRPPRVTPIPVISGPQTAVVVGPEGEEIFTDKYGRVKVKFMWDPNPDSTNTSCWARVATSWAGQHWGSIHIPRIGQEVVVSFMNGDPDQPIVTGSVYNPDQMPPYKLPKHKTVSTLRSRSTQHGGKDNFNELRFEDLKGKEQVFVHAERDKDERVKSESREFVGGNRHLIVRKNQKELVEASKHTAIYGDYVFETGGNKDLHTKGSIFQKTDGNHERTLSGSHLEKIDGSMSLTVGKSIEEKTGTKFAHEAGQEIHLKAGMKVVIEAGVELTLVGPGGFIDIGPSGVTIQGTVVLINSGGSAGQGSGSSPKPPSTEVRKPSHPSVADDGTTFDKL